MKPVIVVEFIPLSFVIACLLRKCIAMSQQVLFEVSLLWFHFALHFIIFIIMNIQ